MCRYMGFSHWIQSMLSTLLRAHHQHGTQGLDTHMACTGSICFCTDPTSLPHQAHHTQRGRRPFNSCAERSLCHVEGWEQQFQTKLPLQLGEISLKAVVHVCQELVGEKHVFCKLLIPASHVEPTTKWRIISQIRRFHCVMVLMIFPALIDWWRWS